MKITWFLALSGAVLLLALLVLLELGILKSPFAMAAPIVAPQTSISETKPSDPTTFVAASQKESKTTRRQALYLLTQQGLVAKTDLAKLISTPLPAYEHLDNPHSAGSYLRQEEIALRVTALEALDKLAIENPAPIQEVLEEIAKSQQEPTLKFLIRISLEGIYNKHPGKLSRTIDAMITEKEKL